MLTTSLYYYEKERNREEEEKVRGERLTGGPRVKMCYVEVELPKWEVVGGLGWPGGTASASFFSFPFL